MFASFLTPAGGLATTLGKELRLVGGYKGGDMPPCVRNEELAGVPAFLLGFPVVMAPKVVRYLFLLDASPPVYEADLTAAHLRATLERAREMGVGNYATLEAYVCSGESVRDVPPDNGQCVSPARFGKQHEDTHERHGLRLVRR